jgi:hypothetical protein
MGGRLVKIEDRVLEILDEEWDNFKKDIRAEVLFLKDEVRKLRLKLEAMEREMHKDGNLL